MSNYADMKNPPICFHALGQPLVDKMWQELQEQKYVIEEYKKIIKDYEKLVRETATTLKNATDKSERKL